MSGMIRCFFMCGLFLLGSQMAWADVIPPEVTECEGKQVGDACGSGKTCQDAKCTRPTPDGGSAYDCVKCSSKAADPIQPTDGGTTKDQGSTSDKASPVKQGGCDASSGGLRFGFALFLLFFGFFFAWQTTNRKKSMKRQRVRRKR